MNMEYQDTVSFLNEREYARYERDGFDEFLKKVKFDFSLPSIHIAGTNGKGGTLFYLENIYSHAGYKVASFHSPYLYDPKEMIRFAGKEIDEESFSRLFNEYKKLFEKYDLSAFEIETFIAFTYFLEKKPDICLIECGMGGEIDATNIFTPILSIITSIALEHTSFLGTTITEIAASKAGIIKEGVPVLLGDLDQNAYDVVKEIAIDNDAKICQKERFYPATYNGKYFSFDYRPYKGLMIKTFAEYQIRNATLAIEACKILMDRFPIKEEDVKEGLLIGEPLLHIEIIGNVILDGAHNPEAITALINSFPKYEEDKLAFMSLGEFSNNMARFNMHILFASFRDKNISIELPALATYCPDIILTTFKHKRARTEEDYFLYEEDYRYIDDYKAALEELRTNYPDDLILVTGSIAFAAEVRKYLLENGRNQG